MDTHQDKGCVFTHIIFEPPSSAVLPAQACLTTFKAIVFLDVCSAVIWFCGKSRHSQVALVSAGGLVLSTASDIVDTGNQLKI